MRKKICVITGTRADYGIWHPVLQAIMASPDLELKLLVTGMHLMKEFGSTVKEIEKDRVPIHAKVDISYQDDTGQAMALFVGKAVAGFSKALGSLKPDLVMVLGDRGEMLAAAIAANYLNVPVAHLHGGELSGHVDGVVRHAVTKLSHLHFTPTRAAGQRILRMGEEPWRITVSGAPALDRILRAEMTPATELAKKYRLDLARPLILVVQHPVSSQIAEAARQIELTLKVVTGSKLPVFLLYPNADAGGRKMIEVIKCYEGRGLIQAHQSIPHVDYLGLLKIAAVLVGNTSSGIIEAPSFKLPVINIGVRQQGRERAGNVLDAAQDIKTIRAALEKALYDKAFRFRVNRIRNPYGDGKASEKIVRVLEQLDLGQRLLQKQITY